MIFVGAIPCLPAGRMNRPYGTGDTMNTTNIDIQKYDLFYGGGWHQARSKQYFESVNPSTGEVIAQIADAGAEDTKKAIAAARRTFDEGEWTNLTVRERGQYLNKIAQLIRENAKVLAELECQDTGKTIKQTTFIDVPTAADTFEYFANVSSQLSGQIIPVPASVISMTVREPMGVVGCIIPWNYPLITMAWKIAPALISGNTVVLKPSAWASLSIIKLTQIIEQADLPKGVINVVTGNGQNVGRVLAEDANVDMLSFTGGTTTGQEVMRLAANTTKKLCLELGSKSPNIVFADCDVEAALGGTMSSIFMNQGQMCTAGARLLLEDKIYSKFIDQLVRKTKNLEIGNSLNYETDFGPLIIFEHREKVLGFIETGKKEGAKLVCGGKIPSTKELKDGFFLEPTIFTDVNNSMTIAREEIFGPVLSVLRFSEVEEAIQIANDTQYGLAAMVWTKDLDKANSVSRKLRCGTVWINTYGGFYNEAPFGGYKQSGFGRELGTEGLLEYTQTKHICTDATPGGRPLVASWF